MRWVNQTALVDKMIQYSSHFILLRMVLPLAASGKNKKSMQPVAELRWLARNWYTTMCEDRQKLFSKWQAWRKIREACMVDMNRKKG